MWSLESRRVDVIPTFYISDEENEAEILMAKCKGREFGMELIEVFDGLVIWGSSVLAGTMATRMPVFAQVNSTMLSTFVVSKFCLFASCPPCEDFGPILTKHWR